MKILFRASILSTLLTTLASAQGILPPKKDAAPIPVESAPSYVLIGNPVPATLNVVDSSGSVRALLSYKPANDVLVVGFYSPRCPKNQEAWNLLKRIFQDYKGWHATFLGISVQPDETLDELAEAMTKANLPYTGVRDDQAQAAHALRATATPQLVIIDEYGTLRFRGDLKDVRKALDAIIGHEPLDVSAELQNVEGCPIP